MKSPGIPRRTFLNRMLRGVFCTAASYPFVLEPNWPSLEKIRVPISGLPNELAGLRIGLLADFHRGLYVTEEYIRSSAERLQAQRPDVILLGGDFVEGNASKYIGSCISALSELKAPLGVFAVLGNHDYWTDAAFISAALRRRDIPVLVNESVELTWRERRFFLIGLDDAWEGTPDVRKSLSGVPSEVMKILLVHEPDYADRLHHLSCWLPLQLSGHSHGGQVILPFLGPPMLPYLARKYPLGLQEVKAHKRWVYTTRGVGLTLPFRFNCRPEVTVLTLAPST